MPAILAWFLTQFTSPISVLIFLRQLLPFLKELYVTFEGHSPEVQTEAMEKAVKVARDHCEGIGCATGLKNI